ncbi:MULTISPECIES: hypothetical protein [unclassified Streptomyces]|uniref:WXG100 family type VII secretion target n=1 Tax=Streptomyces johnsoniae TaxID=3075532 RepID=A0ABU2S388_9ACTN|nr:MULTISPECIES: hypothetical protein [unclassified Streptomyces]MDT0443427.1 hypothetical protein [Streptomyces sp. DSM 41886]
MGSQTLSTLTQQSQGSSTDLGVLIQRLVAAAEPLEGRFRGQGRVAFDAFKLRSEEISHSLNGALSAILGGQSGMDRAFGEGDQETQANAHQGMSSANFDAARFQGRA